MPKNYPVIYSKETHQPLNKTVGTTGLNGNGKQVASAKAIVNLNQFQPIKIRK